MVNTIRRGRGEGGRTTVVVVVVVIEKDTIKIRTVQVVRRKQNESYGNRQKLWIKQVRRNVINGQTSIPPLPRLAEYRHITSQKEEREKRSPKLI